MRVQVLLVSSVLACGRLSFDHQNEQFTDGLPTDGMPDSAPNASEGCADGSREGFVALDVAGCAASWTGALSLRTPQTGTPCGNDLAACLAPADACAVGWHICGGDGNVAELTLPSLTTLDANECATGAAGRFVAAASHCATICTYPPMDMFECTTTSICGQPICCGMSCVDSQCNDGVWPDGTRQHQSFGSTCGAAQANEMTGVLCCRD
jgi:hypothetical protein